MEYRIIETGRRMHQHREYLFEGISILQHPDIVNYFPKLINDFNRIIELGTYYGAFALYLHRIKNPEVELISYDIAPELCQVPKEYGIDFRWGNWWHKKWLTEFKDLMEEISKKTLVICDGGYKEYEFNLCAEYLKPNDVIMVHDYADTFEEFSKITKEIEWYDIADSSYLGVIKTIEKYNLKKHPMYDDFKKVLWGIFIK
jgi:tRNA A58 N-methylase Trm61